MGNETKDILSEILKNAIDLSPTPYLITDKNAVIIYVNNAIINTTGYTPQELIGKKTSVFKSGRHNEMFYKRMWDTLLKGKPFSSRIINKRKDGSMYQLKIDIQPVIINGNIEYFVAREEDLTSLIELENKLIESQKMESIALMVGELTHDFNNFLTVIIGALELIKDDLKENASSKPLVDELLKASKNHAQMVKELLTFARKSQLIFSEINLNKLLNEMKPLILSQLSSKIDLIYELEPDLKNVKADEQQIKQAILNITHNAKDAIGENNNGSVLIRTYNFIAISEYSEPYHEGEYVVIEIIDSGPGIKPEIINHIFEPFFTTKPKGHGTGLGLSSVYGIVKNHNGYVYASNRTDNKSGAVFRIYLPAINTH